MKRALIFGIGGQDGSYLADLLLEKGYEVHGLARRSSYDNLARIAHVRDRVTIHRGDLTDIWSVSMAVLSAFSNTALEGEVYNMADQDEVGWSKDVPSESVRTTYGGCANVLHVLKGTGLRFFQPLSSTMFGLTDEPQDESTPLNPGSPYACAKAAAWHLCKHYRKDHGVWVACGIMFGHDSPRRGPQYLLQKIARQAVEVARGKRDRIELDGGPNAMVDIGWAPYYVDAAWRMLQWDEPDDYCVGTGRGFHIEDLCEKALLEAETNTLSYQLKDTSLPKVKSICNASKANTDLGWVAWDVSAMTVVRRLVRHFMEVK